MNEETFSNPVVSFGADPWVIAHANQYWYCHAGANNSVFVDRTDHLHHIGKATSNEVWRATARGPFSKEIWAPELHRLDGQWVIYVAADDGANRNHRMIALVSDHELPNQPFKLLGKVHLPDDRWAIDMTVMTLGDRGRYAVWSGWDGDENIAQNIYIAKMNNVTTCTGPRVKISSPQYAWERAGSGGKDRLPTINEGPQVLSHGKVTHIVYSAAGSWSDHYCLGRLTLSPNADPMLPKSWVKHTQPVFRKTDSVFGPGHSSFVMDRGQTTWMVYHSAKRKGSGWDRHISMQPIQWTDDEPVFGTPIAPGMPITIPK